MKTKIRLATADDLEEILEITNDAITHTTAIYDYEERTLEEQQIWFSEKNIQEFPVFVAEINSKIAGFATYGNFRNKIGYQFTVEHSVYVNSQFSGNGIGKLLMKKLITYAKNKSYQTMIGVIDAENILSIKFHQQLGFEICGSIPKAGFKFNRWLDITFMQLQLK